MKSIGVVYADQFGAVPAEDPNLTQFGAAAADSRVGIMLPTLNVPEIVSLILNAAQKATAKLPEAQLVEAVTRHLQGQLSVPVEAVGVRLAADGNALLVNLGYGLLCFKLTDAAKKELAQFFRDENRRT